MEGLFLGGGQGVSYRQSGDKSAIATLTSLLLKVIWWSGNSVVENIYSTTELHRRVFFYGPVTEQDGRALYITVPIPLPVYSCGILPIEYVDENCHKKKFIKRALEIRIKIVSTDTFNFNYKSNIQADQKKS